MLKRIVKSTLVLIACLLIFVSFMPMLLSISKINQFLISCVNSRIGGKLHAEEIQIGWTDGILVKGLQIDDPQGRNVADIKKVSCDVALLSLIHAPAIEGRVQVDSPKITLIDDNHDGHFSIENVFTSEPTEKASSEPAKLVLSDLQLSLDIQPQGQAKINLVCQIENNEDGKQEKGAVNLTATAQNVQELEKAYKSALGQAKASAAGTVALDCHIDDFPIKAALPFIRMADPALATMLVPALGDSLNAKISHTLRGDELTLSLLVQSPQLNLKLKSAIKGNTLTIKDQGSLNWQLSPELLALYNIDQKTPTALVATVQPYSGTLGPDGKMPVDIAWKLTAPLALSQGPCSASGTITAAAIQESVDAHAEVTLGKNSVDALLTVNHPLTTPEASCKIALDGETKVDADLELKNSLFTAAVNSNDFSCNAKVPYHFADNILTLKKGEATCSYKTFNAVVDSLDSVINLNKKEAQGTIAIHSDSALFDTRFQVTADKASADGEMKQFPVALLATLANKPELTELLGNTLSANWKATNDQLDVNLQGDNLSFKTSLLIGDNISGNDSTLLSYQLSPKRFDALQEMLKLDKLELKNAVDIALKIKKIELPKKYENLGTFLDGLSLNTLVTVSQTTLAQANKKAVTIAPLTLNVKQSGKDRKVTFSCETDKSVANSAQIAIDGSAHNLWNEEGLQLDNARILLDTNIKNLPLDIFYTEKLVAAFGESINANLKGDLKDMTAGSIVGSIESPRFKSDIACTLHQGTLTLDKPITAEYTLTAEAGEVLLKDVNPLLATASGTKEPIKLIIDSKGFQVPLKHFSIKDTKIPNITIEPGTLTCKNSGMLSLLTNLLRVSKSDVITLWFTPIYVSVENGIVHCKRADALLSDAFPIATWGKIDLLNDKIDMTLGLSGASVAKAFDISGLDPSYMVQIPIRGTTQSPKIDSGLATTKITALKLQQTSSKTTSIIGGLLEAATTIVEKDDPAPAPTTNPLPWADKFHKPKVSPNLLRKLIR
ncbi:MAG: hypothetical protein JSR37_02400 [Verrucomicrobia bacterium]|nr:hypothetical protein [Verrucomicrobiota bacterium]MBS0637004.1 hypothetical protein [Verrucomicrobiota bacterium]